MSAIILTLIAIVAQDAKQRAPFRPWEGFKPGSWAVMKKALEGPEGNWEAVARYELTTKGVKTKTIKGNGAADLLPKEFLFFQWLDASGLTEKPLHDAELPFDGKKLKAKRARRSLEKDGKRVVALDLWRADAVKVPTYMIPVPGVNFGIPPDLVRWRLEVPPDDPKGVLLDLAATRKEKVTVGKKTVECLTIEGTVRERPSRDEEPVEASVRLLVSDDVPGHIVRMEASGEHKKGKQSRRFEMVDFHAVPTTSKANKDD